MLFTIGHSNKQIDEFINILKKNKIDVLVDVRSIPYSSWLPQFSKYELSKSLISSGIRYVWRGKNLGGKKENVNYDEAIEEISKLSKQQNVCIMCSEADPKKCHRYTKLTPSFMMKGVVPKHILWDNDESDNRMKVNSGQASLF
jgi:uncharacterized protein (DUF488 family)